VTDNVHNGIFLVDNADRRRIDNGKGIPDSSIKSGTMSGSSGTGRQDRSLSYFDSSPEPVLSATDSLTSLPDLLVLDLLMTRESFETFR
jgi:hypothetical protein